MKLSKKRPNNSISNEVSNLLKENIINLKLKPGETISEQEIAEQLEISRTPVREAFVRLVLDDLLEVFPQKGTRVSLIDLKEVEDARFIREHLERAALKVVCEKIEDKDIVGLQEIINQQIKSVQSESFEEFFKLDELFHKTILELSDNEKVWQVIQRIDAHLKRIRVLSLVYHEKAQSIISDHNDILTALAKRDEQTADQILTRHMNLLSNEAEVLKERYPHYFSL